MKIINGYVNRPGKHCASTAIRDVCEYNGLFLTEDVAFGLDANIGFTIIKEDKEPDKSIFIGGKSNIFNGNIFKNMGVNFSKYYTSCFLEDSWAQIMAYIDRDIPVIIKTDMYYLDYFKGIYSHFNGHICVLVGYDLEEGIVFVSERQGNIIQEENGYCKLKIESLAKSVDNQAEKEPKWFVAAFDAKSEWINIKEAVRTSISQVANEYFNNDFSGYIVLNTFINELENWLNEISTSGLDQTEQMYCIKRQFIKFAAEIEDIGTGGGLFRKMYGNFLFFAYKNYLYDNILVEMSKKILVSSNRWTELAGLFKNISRKFTYEDIKINGVFRNEVRNIITDCIKNEKEVFENLSKWSK